MDNPPIPRATHEAEIQIGDKRIPCAVLEDGRRVLTQQGFLKAIGRARSAKGGQGSSVDVIPFLAAKNLQALLDDETKANIKSFEFHTVAGRPAYGYTAEALPKVCEVYLKARDNDVLHEWQKKIAIQCDILMRGLATVGIVALIDEATGYQRDRANDALARILEAFIAKELQPWIRTFPSEFYDNLFRLRGLSYPRDTVKRPQYFGQLTNDIIYSRLAPGVLAELKKTTPRNEAGRPTAKYFQKLTSHIGYPKLREHLGAVIALMRVSNNYGEFRERLDKFYPLQTTQLVLVDQDTGQGL